MNTGFSFKASHESRHPESIDTGLVIAMILSSQKCNSFICAVGVIALRYDA